MDSGMIKKKRIMYNENYTSYDAAVQAKFTKHEKTMMIIAAALIILSIISAIYYMP